MQLEVRGAIAFCLLRGRPRPQSMAGRSRAWVLAGICMVLGALLLPAQTLPRASEEGRSSGISSATLDARVESSLRLMTVDEKVGQLVQYSAGQATGPGTGRTDYEDMIARGEIGALLNVVDPHEINRYQRIAMEKSRLHIPLLFGLDVIHGFKTEFPIPLGLASTWDPALVERASRVAAVEASASGIRWTFSPMVDIARRRIALPRAPSTMSATARRRVGETTTPPKSRSILCGSSISLHFTRLSKPVPLP